MNADLAENKYPKDLEAAQTSDGHKARMAQVMTKELWEKLKNHKTASAGWTLTRASLCVGVPVSQPPPVETLATH